jgi:hypothetical protein
MEFYARDSMNKRSFDTKTKRKVSGGTKPAQVFITLQRKTGT